MSYDTQAETTDSRLCWYSELQHKLKHDTHRLLTNKNGEVYRAVVKNTYIRNIAHRFWRTVGQQGGSANATVVVHLCAKFQASTHSTRNNVTLKNASPKKLLLDA